MVLEWLEVGSVSEYGNHRKFVAEMQPLRCPGTDIHLNEDGLSVG